MTSVATDYSKAELGMDKDERKYYRLLKNKYSEDAEIRIVPKKQTTTTLKR